MPPPPAFISLIRHVYVYGSRWAGASYNGYQWYALCGDMCYAPTLEDLQDAELPPPQML